ncbi:MAG: hydrolase [Candidatus Bathyarchaeota archaeon]|nr:hydrolase [Candidatus Bathyarchaeota archaeon]
MTCHGLISRKGTVLVVIDVQEKLFPHIAEKERTAKNVARLIRFAQIMKIPIVLTEQYPKGLRHTIPDVKNLVSAIRPIEKVEFSCLASEKFKESLVNLEAKTLIIVGIEAHICVTQTALESSNNGYRVCVVSDAVSSRNLEDKAVALERLRQNGITVASTEMLIYEILEKAGAPEFKEALKLVK